VKKVTVEIQEDTLKDAPLPSGVNQKLFEAVRKEILGQTKNIKFQNQFPQVNYQHYFAVNPYKKLGLYETSSDLAAQAQTQSDPAKKIKRFGIVHDDSYCEQVDLYNLIHQDNALSQFRFITDYTGKGTFL